MAKPLMTALLALALGLGPAAPALSALRAPAVRLRAPSGRLMPRLAPPALAAGAALPRLLPRAAAARAVPAAAARDENAKPGPVVPAAAARAGAPDAERTGEILGRLAPESAARMPGEEAKALSGELLGESSAGGEGEDASAVAGSPSAPSALAPASGLARASRAAPRAPAAGRRSPTLGERAHYWRALLDSFRWYMTVNVANKWRGHRRQAAQARAAGEVSVRRQRAFFAAMRTTGMSGRFYPLGSVPREDHEVVAAMRGAFDRYFTHPAIGAAERESFEHFMARAATYNLERRSHAYLHKTIRDNLLRASLLPPARLVPFFDGLLQEELARETHDFQANGGQRRVAEAFRETVLSVIAREDAADRSRVLAVVVLGSFASGAAGPRSDFDVELVTADGSPARIREFGARLTAAWDARGHHEIHPVSVHDRAALPTRAYQDMVHSGDYYVISPDPALEAALSRAPGEEPAFALRRDGGFAAGLGLLVQKALIHSTIELEEFKAVRD